MSGYTPEQVLNFWFEELDSSLWFNGGADLDELIKQRFTSMHQAASVGELVHWRASHEGRLAEIILLDQFSRNIYRGQAGAFAQDSLALVLAQEAVRAGALEAVAPNQISFLLLPYMHSESLAVHDQFSAILNQLDMPDFAEYERKHREILDQFGRYPHRNQALSRASTEAELAFINTPGTGF